MPQKRRRGSDTAPDTIVVETSDGMRLRCSISAVGRGADPRWMIMDARGDQFVGPNVTADRTPDGVERLINDWWTERNVGPSE
jgi:hypothetical protein